MDWTKVKFKDTGYPVLDKPPDKPCNNNRYLCEHVNYLLWKYGYLDKGFHLAVCGEFIAENKQKFIDSLFAEWWDITPEEDVVITKSEWNEKV